MAVMVEVAVAEVAALVGVAGVVAVVVVVAAVVVLLVVEESHGSMFGLKIAHFCHFAKRHNGRTYGHTDRWTDPLIEIQGCIKKAGQTD